MSLPSKIKNLHIYKLKIFCLPGLKERQLMPFKCTKCDSSFKRERSLVYHMKHECGIAFPCTLCKQSCKKKDSLRRHLLDVHNIARHQLDKYGAGNNRKYGTILINSYIIYVSCRIQGSAHISFQVWPVRTYLQVQKKLGTPPAMRMWREVIPLSSIRFPIQAEILPETSHDWNTRSRALSAGNVRSRYLTFYFKCLHFEYIFFLNRACGSIRKTIQMWAVWELLQVQATPDPALGRGMWKGSIVCLYAVRLSSKTKVPLEKPSEERSPLWLFAAGPLCLFKPPLTFHFVLLSTVSFPLS